MSHTLIPPHQTSARGVFLKFAFVLDDPLNSIYVVPPVHKKHFEGPTVLERNTKSVRFGNSRREKPLFVTGRDLQPN